MPDNKNPGAEKGNNLDTPKKRSYFGGSLDANSTDFLDFRYNTQEEIDKLNEKMSITGDLDDIIKETNNTKNNKNIESKSSENLDEKDNNKEPIQDEGPIEGDVIENTDQEYNDIEKNNFDNQENEDSSENYQKTDENSNQEDKEFKETDEETTEENDEEDETGNNAKFFDPFELGIDDEGEDDETFEGNDEIFDPFGLNNEDGLEDDLEDNLEENKDTNEEFETNDEIIDPFENENKNEDEDENFDKDNNDTNNDSENTNKENENIEEETEDTEENKDTNEEFETNDDIIDPFENENEDENFDKDNNETNNDSENINKENENTDEENEDISDEESEDISDEESEDISDEESEDISDEESEDISDEESEDISDEENEDISDEESEDISDKKNNKQRKNLIGMPINTNPNEEDEHINKTNDKKIKKNSATGEEITEEEIELEQGQDMPNTEDEEEYQPSAEELFEYEPEFFADDELSQQFKILVQNVRGIFKLERKDGEQNPYFKILGGKTENSTLEYLFYLIEEENEPIDLYIKKVETTNENEEENEHLVQFSYNEDKKLNIFVDEIILYEAINKYDSNSTEYRDTKAILEKFIFLTQNYYDKLKSELDKQREEKQKKKQLQQIFKGF